MELEIKCYCSCIHVYVEKKNTQTRELRQQHNARLHLCGNLGPWGIGPVPTPSSAPPTITTKPQISIRLLHKHNTMAEPQPPNVHEGATTAAADEEDVHATAKSAEDRKAASALASLDANDDAATGSKEVDHEAVSKAMKSLGGAKPPAAAKTTAPTKNVKVDAADVALLVDELELTKPKATELLKSHDGDAVKAMRAWVRA